MPIQEALLLLRISSTHKLDYLLRCVPPSAMEKLAVDFDGQLMDAFRVTIIILQIINYNSYLHESCTTQSYALSRNTRRALA